MLNNITPRMDLIIVKREQQRLTFSEIDSDLNLSSGHSSALYRQAQKILELRETFATCIDDKAGRLEVCERLRNSIKNSFSDKTIRDFQGMKYSDILRAKNIGKKGADEISEALEKFGIHLKRDQRKFAEQTVTINEKTALKAAIHLLEIRGRENAIERFLEEFGFK